MLLTDRFYLPYVSCSLCSFILHWPHLHGHHISLGEGQIFLKTRLYCTTYYHQLHRWPLVHLWTLLPFYCAVAQSPWISKDREYSTGCSRTCSSSTAALLSPSLVDVWCTATWSAMLKPCMGFHYLFYMGEWEDLELTSFFWQSFVYFFYPDGVQHGWIWENEVHIQSTWEWPWESSLHSRESCLIFWSPWARMSWKTWIVSDKTEWMAHKGLYLFLGILLIAESWFSHVII